MSNEQGWDFLEQRKRLRYYIQAISVVKQKIDIVVEIPSAHDA
jgi:hypothetical protein